LRSVLVVVGGLVAGLALVPLPAAAQDQFVAQVLTEVCLPYVNRARSFEKAIRAARDLDFRRPVADRAPLEDWASEVDLISQDGVWRVRLEEGSVEHEGVQAYRVTCSISSRRASGRSLADFGRRAFRNEDYWDRGPENPWRWDRRHSRPDEYSLFVEVADRAGVGGAMVVTGAYF